MTPRVAVVGGGVAGAAVAHALREDRADVTIFERAGRVGGRTAARRRGETVYDYGANYVTDDDERVADLLTGELSEGLVDTEGPVWTFDAGGEISEGRGNGHKWTYESGVETLAGRLVDRSDATVETGTEVTGLRRDGEEWTIEADGAAFGPFDGVALTPPAPQTGELLAGADWEHDRKDALVEALRDVPYRTIWSLALHYPDELERPYYGLVNTDRDHEIGWLAREECKPGHVSDGESLLIVQMAPDWSAERYDADGADVVAEALPIVADLLDDGRLADPDWTDHQRWGLALPDDGVDAELLDAVADDGLWFAGDWVAGEGRAHAAIGTGLDAGDRIRERFE